MNSSSDEKELLEMSVNLSDNQILHLAAEILQKAMSDHSGGFCIGAHEHVLYVKPSQSFLKIAVLVYMFELRTPVLLNNSPIIRLSNIHEQCQD
ncbi:hypothetical protein NQ315_003184 [Exocentrus adspersus]|uniref:Uncharacterized protein n=1 Tax=Exocentrus adspersus TaxID=1586481 RepID=A0AAV8VM92_9CUCU|nr:hypothetical protein NQ315_003184 [Exocentrus adspersus]